MTSVATPQDLDVQQLSKDLNEAVAQVKEIQVLVTSFIDTIVVRKNDETEKETQVIKATVKQVHAITCKLDKLGSKYSKLRLYHIHAVPLGNTGYVSLDPTEEQSGFYKQLLDCYSWLKKLDRDANHALNNLKRKHTSGDCDTTPAKMKRNAEMTLQDLITSMKSKFLNLSFNDNMISSECCLEVKAPGAFTVNIFFSGLIISHAIVKSVNECFTLESLEHSEYLVFKRITDVFMTIILRLLQKDEKDMLREFLAYINDYKHVFNMKCKTCNMHLCSDSGSVHLLPPVWKDLNMSDFYHLSCKML